MSTKSYKFLLKFLLIGFKKHKIYFVIIKQLFSSTQIDD